MGRVGAKDVAVHLIPRSVAHLGYHRLKMLALEGGTKGERGVSAVQYSSPTLLPSLSPFLPPSLPLRPTHSRS